MNVQQMEELVIVRMVQHVQTQMDHLHAIVLTGGLVHFVLMVGEQSMYLKLGLYF